MKAVVLAGGKGTRLAPYTHILPKPLLPIGDMPILEVLLKQMKRAGIEDIILTVGEQMLQSMGYKALIAQGGREAVELYGKKKDRINLVVLDLIMPDLGGAETFEFLKKMNPSLRILLSSGYGRDGQVEEILGRGCDGFIQKPFDMNELSSKIRGILDSGPNDLDCGKA